MKEKLNNESKLNKSYKDYKDCKNCKDYKEIKTNKKKKHIKHTKQIYAIISLLICMVLVTYTLLTMPFTKNEIANASSSINKKICPIGRLVGLKLYTKGVLVIGMTEIDGINGKTYMPYKNTGIKEGDFIKEVNGKEVESTAELMKIVNNCEGNEIELKVQSDNSEFECKIKPVKSLDGNYMLGLWVRDAALGIGTLTYYDKENKTFGTLGHGLYDVDTGKLLNIKGGEIVTSRIISIVKGGKNRPGEIRGIVDNGEKIGIIESNTPIGVYGKIDNEEYIEKISLPEVNVAARNEIKQGKATIICQLENDSAPKEYEIEIRKIFKSNSKDNKSMFIKVTDKKLIEKTGGIIPGMSGTPIIQNKKFIGAITNVLLKNPEYGYAIFADLMIK